MSKYAQIPATAFKNLQLNAGIILKDFKPEDGSFKNEDILGATTGGINFTATPTFNDFAEDVDNAPKNMKEFKKLDSWECKLTTTFISVSADLTQYLISVADVDSSSIEGVSKITPRKDVDIANDFRDIWFVCDYSDNNVGENAGFYAIHLMDALNTDGFSIQTADKEKGQFSAGFVGHVSSETQDVVPFEVYVKTSVSA